MSKKDFILIARTIETLPAWAPSLGNASLREIAEHFANMLGNNHPRFDRARFIAACLKSVEA